MQVTELNYFIPMSGFLWTSFTNWGQYILPWTKTHKKLNLEQQRKVTVVSVSVAQSIYSHSSSSAAGSAAIWLVALLSWQETLCRHSKKTGLWGQTVTVTLLLWMHEDVKQPFWCLWRQSFSRMNSSQQKRRHWIQPPPTMRAPPAGPVRKI